MASLIYPFPRILAVHLKYAPANTSRKKKEATSCQGRMGLLVSVLCTFFFLVQILLITCPLRWADMIVIMPQACLEKPKHTTDSFGSFFIPASFWLQLEPAMRAEADAAVRWHHCRRGFSYSASSSKGFHCCWKDWVTSWHFDDMHPRWRGKAEICCPLQTLIIAVAGGGKLI